LSSANSIGFPFIELRKVESTNNYAMGLIHEGMAQHGTVVFAHEQTKGKGQRNKHWFASPGQNVTLSLIIHPFGLSPTQTFLLSMSVANGLQQFFSKYAGNDTKIKWPNDLYWGDRKAAGILIENIIQGKLWKYAIIGIGLNVNQTNFGTVKATSLKTITTNSYDTVEIAKELLTFLSSSLEELRSSPSDIPAFYQRHLYKFNQIVRLRQGDKIIEGLIMRVNDDGMLVVKESKNQIEIAFTMGEIEWL
jgi:BirA family transcriptional regulator, biotin operon repressor / biotin---[acetyl-CoA-carboxylase] ligase